MQRHPYEISWVQGDVRVIECLSCGYKHLDPIPSDEVLSEFYMNDYFSTTHSFNYDLVNEDYIAKRIQYLPMNRKYSDIFNKVKDLIGEDTSESRFMLDIGCGNDLLSKFFQMRAWKSYAVEPSTKAADFLSKFEVDVINQFIDSTIKLPRNDFSFVNMQFVLEHIHNPKEVLLNIQQHLNSRGIIRLVVPNDFNESQLAYKEFNKEEFHWIKYPDHINYFTFSSLSHLLSECGFKEMYRTTSFPVEFLLLGGINYYSNPAEQSKVGPFIRNFENSFINTGRKETLDQLYESLSQLGLGRSVIIYAQKN